MPITVEQFEPQFDRLCAAFAISKAEKIKTEWFKEFEDCDYFTFCRVFKSLQRGDRFPSWGMVWDTYRPILPAHLKIQARKGCNDCRGGKVFFVDYVQDTGEGSKNGVIAYNMVGNCGICSKDVMMGCDNVSRKNMVLQGDGEYWTQRAIDKHPTELKKVEEAVKTRRKIWKKERFARKMSQLSKEDVLS